jgi:hypothetical protein
MSAAAAAAGVTSDAATEFLTAPISRRRAEARALACDAYLARIQQLYGGTSQAEVKSGADAVRANTNTKVASLYDFEGILEPAPNTERSAAENRALFVKNANADIRKLSEIDLIMLNRYYADRLYSIAAMAEKSRVIAAMEHRRLNAGALLSAIDRALQCNKDAIGISGRITAALSIAKKHFGREYDAEFIQGVYAEFALILDVQMSEANAALGGAGAKAHARWLAGIAQEVLLVDLRDACAAADVARGCHSARETLAALLLAHHLVVGAIIEGVVGNTAGGGTVGAGAATSPANAAVNIASTSADAPASALMDEMNIVKQRIKAAADAAVRNVTAAADALQARDEERLTRLITGK